MLISAIIAANLLLLLALAVVAVFASLRSYERGYEAGQVDRPDYKAAYTRDHREGVMSVETERDELLAELEDTRATLLVAKTLADAIIADHGSDHRTGNVWVIPTGGDLGYEQVRAALRHDGTEGAR